MADKYISQLTAKETIVGTDELPIAAAGATGAGAMKKTTLQEIIDLVTSGSLEFTDLVGTDWDGTYKRTTLTANAAFTITPVTLNGVLLIKDNASHTVTINGTSIAVNPTGATMLGYVKDGDDIYIIDRFGIPILLVAVDLNPPQLVSATVISPTLIRQVYNKIVTATNVGYSGKKGLATHNPLSVSGSGTDTLDFVYPTMIPGDSITISYDSLTGDTLSVPGVELVSFTDAAVTNSLVATPYANLKSIDSGGTTPGTIQFAVPTKFKFGNGGTDTPFTVAAWVKLSYSDALGAFHLQLKNVGDMIWAIGVNGYGYMYMGVNTDNTNKFSYSDTTGGTINVWSFLTWEYDGNKLSTSFKLTRNLATVPIFGFGNEGTYIGMPNLGDEFVLSLVGKADGIVILNKDISDAERIELYNSGVPIDVRASSVGANIVGYWLMEDNVLDYSADGMADGTPSGLVYSSDRPL